MLPVKPLISVIIPVYNVHPAFLRKCVLSVVKQYYPEWELCLCDDASTQKTTKMALSRLAAMDPRIKVRYRETNAHIAMATNDALELAGGEFVAFLDNDDMLPPHALAEMAMAIARNPEADVLYSDVDQITSSGKQRLSPHFKPDWSPDTLMSCMYMSQLMVIRRQLVEQIGGMRQGYDGAQDYDLALRVTELARQIVHIPKILYHCRLTGSYTAMQGVSVKPCAIDATLRAKKDALSRRGLLGTVEYERLYEQARVTYAVQGTPLVSIILPTRDYAGDVERCIVSIYEKTTYRNFEVILIDNGSVEEASHKTFEDLSKKYQVKVFRKDIDFNYSVLNNFGVSHARGEYLLFLNNDTEVISSDWLARMLGFAQLAHIGAVGARLFYPDGKLQHVGVVNYGIGPWHAYCGLEPSELLHYRPNMDCNWLAVTGACMLVAKQKFHLVGGFDEDLAVAYNDVALCIALYKKGFFNIVSQKSCLFHFESKSRGRDGLDSRKFERLIEEVSMLYRKYPAFKGYDPFYNCNFLQDQNDFSI